MPPLLKVSFKGLTFFCIFAHSTPFFFVTRLSNLTLQDTIRIPKFTPGGRPPQSTNPFAECHRFLHTARRHPKPHYSSENRLCCGIYYEALFPTSLSNLVSQSDHFGNSPKPEPCAVQRPSLFDTRRTRAVVRSPARSETH